MPTKDQVTLRKCPFCGGEAIWTNDVGPRDDYYVEFIECQNCGASTVHKRGIVRESWNHRPEEDRLKAMCEELAEALENLANQTVIKEYNGHCFKAAREAIAHYKQENP